MVAKGSLVALAAMFIVAALFNLRLGFGAQAQDCIDSSMFLTRYKKPEKLSRGDYVAFVGNQMGQPYDGHIFIKKIGAVPGDRVKIAKGELFINNELVGALDVAEKAAAKLGVQTATFERDTVVPEGYVFMIGTKPRSYDSRYWGLLPAGNVIGSMYPII